MNRSQRRSGREKPISRGRKPRVASAASGTVLALGMSWAAVDASADVAPHALSHAGITHSQGTLAPAGREILIIDARVTARHELAAAARRNVETFILDSGRDGVAQITEILATRRGLAAVHLLAHGRSGALLLGASELSKANIEDYTSSLSRWFDATGAHEVRPDLLVYGCEVSAGDEGRAFVARLAESTGADVAASTDVTGGEGRGANWRLEVASGRIEATLPIASDVARAYDATLDVYAVSSLADSGPGTLRQAIIDANAHAGSDTIVFTTTCGGGGTCSTDGSLTGVINIETHLFVTDDVSFIGPGRDRLTLDGHLAPAHPDDFGIMWVYGSSMDVIDVSISGLAFEHARANYSYGGGVTAYDAVVSIRDCRFVDDRAAGAYGGGAILSRGSEVSIEDCEFLENSAGAYGGAISSSGYGIRDATMTIERSLFRENTSAYGGAIHVGTGASLEATDCALIGNVSDTLGGAILSEGTVVVGNSTLSGNRSETGSAIAVRYAGGVELVHVTVVSTQDSAPDAGAPGSGSALYFGGTEIETSRVTDSIVWGAALDLESGGQVAAPTVRRSMFGVSSGPLLVEAGTVVGEDPRLLPLANHGGPTLIHAIESTSPAIDRGNNPRSYAHDQRGPGFARVVGQAADLGAFEYAAPAPVDAGMTPDSGDSEIEPSGGCGCAAVGKHRAPSTRGLGALVLGALALFRRRRR